MATNLPMILLADDSSDDRKMVQMALARLENPCVLETVGDGEALVSALRGGLRPSLVLLDLNLPVKSGLEALREIKADPDFRALPVLVWSTSSNPAEILESYEAGANSFFIKPDSFDLVLYMMRAITRYWLSSAGFGGTLK